MLPIYLLTSIALQGLLRPTMLTSGISKSLSSLGYSRCPLNICVTPVFSVILACLPVWRLLWSTGFFKTMIRAISGHSFGRPMYRVDGPWDQHLPTVYLSRLYAFRLLVQGRSRWLDRLIGTVCRQTSLLLTVYPYIVIAWNFSVLPFVSMRCFITILFPVVVA